MAGPGEHDAFDRSADRGGSQGFGDAGKTVMHHQTLREDETRHVEPVAADFHFSRCAVLSKIFVNKAANECAVREQA